MNPLPQRRQFLAQVSAAAALGAGGSAPRQLHASPAVAAPLGNAEHCVLIWLGGGASQIDTFDPKPKGDPKSQKPGAYYNAINTAVREVQVCEHFGRCAPLLDRFALLRTVHHNVIDEHAAAANRMHTGRPTSGTTVYPSLGSIVAHEKNSPGADVPPYVVMGYPNLTRGPGFLGAKHSYLYLTETTAGPVGLTRPDNITPQRAARREQLLAATRAGYRQRTRGDQRVADYDAVAEQRQKLTGPEFMDAFQLDREPAELRNRFGGEFGQRCLLARRLVERGVRFIEVAHNMNFVNGMGWDVHAEGIVEQHLLIDRLDQALAALVTDLEAKKLLDKTLIVVATEFGRPAEFDGGGGRGHQSHAFSIALAGGGLQTGRAIGVTDHLANRIVERPVSVPDLFATIVAALGIDPAKALFDGDRPVPVTDNGTPLVELFA